MKHGLGIAAALFSASLAMSQGAQASDSLLGAVLGAGAGVVVGHAIGGSDGAIVGGGIGAIAGAAIASERDRYHDRYAPARRVVYYDTPQVIDHRHVRYIERGRRWDDRPWHGWRERRGERHWQDD